MWAEKGGLDFEGRARWDAWTARKGMPPGKAKLEFVKVRDIRATDSTCGRHQGRGIVITVAHDTTATGPNHARALACLASNDGKPPASNLRPCSFRAPKPHPHTHRKAAKIDVGCSQTYYEFLPKALYKDER